MRMQVFEELLIDRTISSCELLQKLILRHLNLGHASLRTRGCKNHRIPGPAVSGTHRIVRFRHSRYYLALRLSLTGVEVG